MIGGDLDTPGLRRLWGRQRGKKLRPRQESLLADLLPRLAVPIPAAAPIDLEALFGRAAPVFLEIGFGSGEHLAAAAARDPAIDHLGAEGYRNGVAALLARVEAEGLANLRIHHGDARDLLAALPDGALAQVTILFPDPWPKRRHWRRRLVSPATLAALARVMARGAELRFASDIASYVDWTLVHVLADGRFAWPAAAAGDWRRPFSDHVATRYEAKALAAGRKPAYLRFVRETC